MRAKRVNGTILERFKAKYLIKENGCWEWTAFRNKKGYGMLDINGRMTIASRVSYMIFIGDIEHNFMVCHKCDNPCCCNPFHLFKGTALDNCIDAQNKGRYPLAIHPSLRTYNKGCRCDDCYKIGSNYHKDIYKRKKLLSLLHANNA